MLMMQVLMKKTVAAWNEFKKERFSPKSEEIGDEEASDLTTEDITHLQLISQHLFQLATREYVLLLSQLPLPSVRHLSYIFSEPNLTLFQW